MKWLTVALLGFCLGLAVSPLVVVALYVGMHRSRQDGTH